jgi:hypothetical protein
MGFSKSIFKFYNYIKNNIKCIKFLKNKSLFPFIIPDTLFISILPIIMYGEWAYFEWIWYQNYC